MLSFPRSESGDSQGKKKEKTKKMAQQQQKQQQREANSAAAVSQTGTGGNQVNRRVAFTVNLSITYCDKLCEHMRGRTFLFVDHQLTAQSRSV